MSENTRTWNSLYLEWLQELHDASKESSSSNRPNQQLTYQRAINSLEACPKSFQHPSQLQELKYIGAKICKALEKRTQKYCTANGIPMPDNPDTNVSYVSPQQAERNNSNNNNKKRPTKTFVPRYRSGGYAIVLALRKNERKNGKIGDGMTKPQIIDLARDFCDAPFEVNPNTGSYYSAWNSINTIIKNGLIYENKKRFSTYYLTDSGRSIADKLRQVAKEKTPSQVSQMWSSPLTADEQQRVQHQQNPTRRLSGPPTSSPLNGGDGNGGGETGLSPSFYTSYWHPGAYTIKLFVDNRETRMSSDDTLLETECKRQDVNMELTELPVGDALWVAEHNNTKTIAVLDHILERKRLDDLIKSIQDNRFTEQKFRLHRSSIQNIVYLIEQPSGMACPYRYRKTVQTSLSQILISEGFFLKRTLGPEDTIKYLVSMTKYLQDRYKDSAITVVHPKAKTYRQSMDDARNRLTTSTIGINYDHFKNALTKSGLITIRDLFIKMLMTIRGVTWERAVTIQRLYPTPYDLWQAYDNLTSEEDRKELLSKATASYISKKKCSKNLSEKVYEIWGQQ